MSQYNLDLHGEALLEEYRQQMPLYEQLQQVVMHELGNLISQSGIEVNSTESRIKVRSRWQASWSARVPSMPPSTTSPTSSGHASSRSTTRTSTA